MGTFLLIDTSNRRTVGEKDGAFISPGCIGRSFSVDSPQSVLEIHSDLYSPAADSPLESGHRSSRSCSSRFSSMKHQWSLDAAFAAEDGHALLSVDVDLQELKGMEKEVDEQAPVKRDSKAETVWERRRKPEMSPPQLLAQASLLSAAPSQDISFFQTAPWHLDMQVSGIPAPAADLCLLSGKLSQLPSGGVCPALPHLYPGVWHAPVGSENDAELDAAGEKLMEGEVEEMKDEKEAPCSPQALCSPLAEAQWGVTTESGRVIVENGCLIIESATEAPIDQDLYFTGGDHSFVLVELPAAAAGPQPVLLKSCAARSAASCTTALDFGGSVHLECDASSKPAPYMGAGCFAVPDRPPGTSEREPYLDMYSDYSHGSALGGEQVLQGYELPLVAYVGAGCFSESVEKVFAPLVTSPYQKDSWRQQRAAVLGCPQGTPVANRGSRASERSRKSSSSNSYSISVTDWDLENDTPFVEQGGLLKGQVVPIEGELPLAEAGACTARGGNGDGEPGDRTALCQLSRSPRHRPCADAKSSRPLLCFSPLTPLQWLPTLLRSGRSLLSP